MANTLILAVAGGRKTQGIVEHCASLPTKSKVLIATFMVSNQAELVDRACQHLGGRSNTQIQGWYSFLLRDFVWPFLPFKFPGQVINGFDYEGRPNRYAKRGVDRFFSPGGRVYASELGRLASELIVDSKGALAHRLECIYDEILIDEVQDLGSHDFDILDFLFECDIEIRIVGDVRQSVVSTNPRSSKYKKYKNASSIEWFRQRKLNGILKIIESNTTWRCHKLIADFSDSIFSPTWGFVATKSLNNVKTGHDGVFLVREDNVQEYVSNFKPQCLRHSIASGKEFDFDFMNFRVSKGRSFERVLIVPTDGIKRFLSKGEYLKELPASSFYVAVTRAKQSVAIVVPNTGSLNLPVWKPVSA